MATSGATSPVPRSAWKISSRAPSGCARRLARSSAGCSWAAGAASTSSTAATTTLWGSGGTRGWDTGTRPYRLGRGRPATRRRRSRPAGRTYDVAAMVAAPSSRSSPLRLPSPSVVVLVGPSAAGKTTWAEANFAPHQVVSSDRLRVLVGEGEDDQRASPDAFRLLDAVLLARLQRRLTTVVDTLGFEADLRERCRQLAAAAGMPCHAVAFDTPPAECRARNRARERQVPERALSAQLRAWAELQPRLAEEGFAAVHAPGAVQLVPAELYDAGAPGRPAPGSLRFGLQVNTFEGPGGPAELATGCGRSPRRPKRRLRLLVGHGPPAPDPPGRPGVGRPARVLHHARLPRRGHRAHPPGPAGGRRQLPQRRPAREDGGEPRRPVRRAGHCGLGLAWFEGEHRAYGIPFPSRAERYELLEDALQLLPLLWGKGAPAFEGRRLRVPEAPATPRPLQERIPLLVGGPASAGPCGSWPATPTPATSSATPHRPAQGRGAPRPLRRPWTATRPRSR